ncbi:MAG: SEC-C domain-containing protein [Armatimonadetes bacterium]|nr:SEC-C domain-containing protein [Armatimonadota bacterium]
MARDEFSSEVRRRVADRAGHHCSNPTCGVRTTGPDSTERGVLKVGEAAHITAASKGGPRYDPHLSPEERRSIRNAIWLCCNCAELIDRDATPHTVEVLKTWKQTAEARARDAIGGEPLGAEHPFLVPTSRNPFFSGRSQELAGIQSVLDPTLRRLVVHAITGLGGVGKSQLALEYAYTCRDRYGAVLWLDASADHIDSSLRDLRNRLLPREQNSTAIRSWLANHRGWLLIVDDLEPGTRLDAIVPPGASGCVLATTREETPQRLGVIDPVKLDSLNLESSLHFILCRTNRPSCTTPERDAAQSLCQELGGLPLALEQAGAFIVETGISFHDYVTQFRVKRIEFLESAGPSLGGYNATVATTWLLSFAAVRKVSGPATQILRLAAFCSPERIPFWLFTEGVDGLPRALRLEVKAINASATAFLGILRPLRNYSLVRVEPGTDSFSIHRIVQEVTRARLREKERAALVNHLISTIAHAFPETDSRRNWRRCDELLPHATVAARLADQTGARGEETAFLLHSVSSALQARGQTDAIEDVITQAEQHCTTVFGPESKEVLWQRLKLAEHYLRQGATDKTRSILRQTESTHPDDPAVVAALGQYYLNVRRPEDAQTYYEALLRKSREDTKLSHWFVVGHMGIGMATAAMGGPGLRNAENHFLIALRNCVRLYGKRDPLEAAILEQYCLVLRKTGRKQVARYYELELRTIRIAHEIRYPSTPHESYFGDAEDIFEALSASAGPPELTLGKMHSWSPPSRPGRNDVCPCGSWEKFKNCCGKTPTR